jgi:tetratricopeptide (TPR) repeat protein
MRRDPLVILALVVVTVAAFWRVGQCSFVNYDDPAYVSGNPLVQRGLTVEGIQWAFGSLHGDVTYWHPLTWLSHMLDCEIFGVRPGAHHWVSLFFHSLNCVLLFVFLRRMTGALWRSALVAGLWSIHPLQVDSVAWIAERKNLLSALFWLLASIAYVRYAEKPGAVRYGLVVVAMALGLMCKPVLVVLPCALLLLDFWPLRRVAWMRPAVEPVSPEGGTAVPQFAPAGFGRLVLEKIPLFALAAVASAITMGAHVSMGSLAQEDYLPLRLRLANAAVSYVRYLNKFIWPGDLAVMYPHPIVWPGWMVWGSVGILAVATIIILLAWRRAPYLPVGWCWFLGVLVPFIGLVQAGLQSMADRFVYLPLIGLLLATVWGIADWAAQWRPRRSAALGLAGLALAGLLGATHRQVGYWRDSESLFRRAVAVTENNYVMLGNLASTLYEQGMTGGDRRKLEEALVYAEAAVRAHPRRYPTRIVLAMVLDGLGRTAESGGQLVTACEFAPMDALLRFHLGRMLAEKGRIPEAVLQYRISLRLEPNRPGTLNNLAWLLATHPDARNRDGAEAVRLADRACELTGRREAVLLGTLAAAYAEANRFPDAVKAAEEAIALARASGAQALVETNRLYLELYRANRPCRVAAP